MDSDAAANNEETGTPLGEPRTAWHLPEFDEQVGNVPA